MSQSSRSGSETHTARIQVEPSAGSAGYEGRNRGFGLPPAEARLALLALASKKLNVPVDHLAVSRGRHCTSTNRIGGHLCELVAVRRWASRHGNRLR